MLNDLDNSENGIIQEETVESNGLSSKKLMLTPYNAQQFKINPKYYKHLIEILTTYSDPIFNYLSLPELSAARGVNKMFLSIIHEYLQKRLKIEIQNITSYQALNQEKTSFFMKNIDSQIPISNKNWLNFDLQSVTNVIQSLSRETITQLRGIKNLGKFSDNIYAPFCIIFGFNKSTYPKIRSDGWKKTAGKILSDSNFFIKASKLDLENFNDNDMLEAFVSLNLPELDVDTIRRYCPALAELIKWCQAVVSYHILIHPYVYRNDKCQIIPGGEVYKFAQNMNYLINRFYKFKRFLFNLGLIKIPLGDYVFNLQHSREAAVPVSNFKTILTESMIGNIFSYLPIKQRFKFMKVNTLFFNGFKFSLEKSCFELLKEIFGFKFQAFDRLSQKLPLLYENNVFSKYFIMLDDILNSECSVNENGINYIPFMSKEHLNDLKFLKIDNDITNTICKVLCVICGERVERKPTNKGDFKPMYMQKVKQLALSGNLSKIMRNIDKIDLTKSQCKVLSEGMYKFYSPEKLEAVKKINRGLYQLLIWELFVFEFIREFNPFSLISIDLLVNAYKLEPDEADMIVYYNKLMCFLKYNLKAKFHFASFSLEGPLRCPNYDFKKLIALLKANYEKENINVDPIFDTPLADHAKISTVYFESKDLIPHAAKPALYERIMIEIVSTSLEGIHNSGLSSEESIENRQNEDNLGVIEEENSGSLPSANINTMPRGKAYQTAILASINPTNNINSGNSIIESPNNNPSSLIEDVEPCLKNINDDIIIQSILFYLDIKSLPKFSLVNKKCNRCVKTHIFIRLYYLNKEKEMIEQEREDIVVGIYNKRNRFYLDFEMAPPSKEHACTLMKQLVREDVLELKQVFKKYNKTYESVIAPLVVLLGEKPKTGFKYDGTKVVNYFEPAQKMIYKRDFAKKIQNLGLEIIPSQVFNLAETLLQDPVFSGNKVRGLSPCLIHTISWAMGVIEFHRAVRMYSLSYYDYDILEPEEIKFCEQMDGIALLFYSLQRYANKHCKKYEKKAQNLMKNME